MRSNLVSASAAFNLPVVSMISATKTAMSFPRCLSDRSAFSCCLTAALVCGSKMSSNALYAAAPFPMSTLRRNCCCACFIVLKMW